jgi:hypothetical protein
VGRRGALRAIGGAVFGTVALVALRPLRGDAPCVVPCGTNCCQNNQICRNAAAGTCGCPSGTTTCGPACCENAGTCTGTSRQACCCPAGLTPCGDVCCGAGIPCLDKSRTICGCGAGTKLCRYGASVTCCPSGTQCPPTATCPGPPAAILASCYKLLVSDEALKEHVVPIVWEDS